jgi:hypothetical protein
MSLIIPRTLTALSVRQPWASHIADAQKRIEVRTWSTKYRGPLLICASQRKHDDLPTGCALCVVDLVDVRPMTENDEDDALCYFDDIGEYAWVLRNPRRVDHFPVKGRLNLYQVELPAAVHAKLLTTKPVPRPKTRVNWREEPDDGSTTGGDGVLSGIGDLLRVFD